MMDLTTHGLAMLLFAAVVFALFVHNRWSIPTISLGMLVALPLGFTLFPLVVDGKAVSGARFLAGFASPALVAICALMIVGHALVVTGALQPVARRLANLVVKHPRSALLAVLVLAASVSGVINDTPVVVLLIPLLLSAASQAKVPAAKLLLPMNYAVLIGGMATTIGTSTNLIVVGIALSLGVNRFGIFDWFGLVALAAVPGLAYLWLVAPRLLRHVPALPQDLSNDVFEAELLIDKDSPLVGGPLSAAFKAVDYQLPLVNLRRASLTLAPLPSRLLRAGDRLIIRDTALRLKELEGQLGAALHAVTPSDGDAAADPESDPSPDEPAQPAAIVAQMIVTTGSPLEGRSVRQERLAERFGFVVVGVRTTAQRASWQREGLTDRLVRVGDVLLVQGDAAAMRKAQRDGLGLLLDERFAVARQDKAGIAILVMAAVVVLAASMTLPIEIAALSGALVLLLTRCLSWDDITQSLSAKVILLVAASLALGDGLSLTGATDWLAQGLATKAGALSAAWLVALLMGLMGLVTNFVSNNAAAAIGTPLAVSLAQALDTPAEPLVLAVLFGCNLCYLTPMGYQTNLLVMNAGGYRFSDFLRVGAPLFLIMWSALSFLLAWRYGLL
jgi:di/tricarboxylate transporter